MNKFAIRLLLLAMFTATTAGLSMIAPAGAATDGSVTAKTKHHRRASHAGSKAQAPRTPSQQYPANMADDPNRKVSY